MGDKTRRRRNTVILFVCLAAVFMFLFILRSKKELSDSADSGLAAVIQIDSETVHTMDLDIDAQYTAKTEDGHYNIIVVEDGSVMVTEADCANQVCVKTGKIRNMGEVIACLPHRMIIYIESTNVDE